MGRIRKLEVGILNIKLHPHDVSRYVELFYDLFEVGDLVKVRGDDWGTTNFIKQIVQSSPEDGLYGTLYRFTHIDPTKAWLDIKSRRALIDANGDPIPQVSSDRHPNIREVNFVFYPQGHLFFFDARTITPGMAQKLLSELCSSRRIKTKFNPVQVEIICQEEVVSRILEIPILTRLQITISRPNGDVLSARKKAILQSMEDQGIRTLNETITSTRTEGIRPSEDTVALMELGTTNGRVYAVGYAGDRRVVESTDPHPLIEHTEYDEERTTPLRALINFSSQLLQKVVARG